MAIRLAIPFHPPPDGVVGGHSPLRTMGVLYNDLNSHEITGYDFFDPFDIAMGIFSRFENWDPNRGGVGQIAGRRGVIQILEEPGSMATPETVNLSYLPGGFYPSSPYVRGIVAMLFNGANAIDMSVAFYDRSPFYNSANWSSWTVFNSSTTPTTSNFSVYPAAQGMGFSGVGEWKPSVNGHINMAFGAYEDSYPRFGLYLNRDKDEPYADGFFSIPSTVGAEGGYTEKVGFIACPEKPWFDLSDSNSSVSSYAVIPPGEASGTITEADICSYTGAGTYVFRPSGVCYEGAYKFWFLPKNEKGEFGPPIASTELNIPGKNYESGLGVGEHVRLRGVSVLLKLRIDDAFDKIRPDIRSFGVWAEYKNLSPLGDVWTTPKDENGYGLAAAPENIPPSYVGELNLNGRQYDPITSDNFGVLWADNSHNWPHSPNFHAFTGRSGDWIRAKKVFVDPDTFIRIDVDNYVFNWQYHNRLLRDETVSSPSTTRIHIEVDGFFGSESIIVDTIDFFGYEYKYVANGKSYVLLSVTTLPTWATDTYKNIRFCYPWGATTGAYQLSYHISDPETWDQSKPMPFPRDADDGYDLDYPRYKKHAESLGSTFRGCFDVWINGKNDTTGVYFTWVNDFGISETGRFRFRLEVGERVSGLAYIDDSRFIVSTETKSLYGYHKLVDDVYVPVFEDFKLKYGNIAKNLIFYDREIYGVDPKFGPWFITIDPLRSIREDISPISDQILLMNTGQQVAFRRRIESYNYVSYDQSLDVISIGTDRERIVFSFPNLTISAMPDRGGSTNIDAYSKDDNAHCWYTYYRVGGTGVWSFDYMSTATIGTIETVEGIALKLRLTIAGHTYNQGEYVHIFASKYYNGIHKIVGTGVNHITIDGVFIDNDPGALLTLWGTDCLLDLTEGPSGLLIAHNQNHVIGFSDVDYAYDNPNDSDLIIVRSLELPLIRVSEIYPEACSLEQIFLRGGIANNWGTGIAGASAFGITTSCYREEYPVDYNYSSVSGTGSRPFISDWMRGINLNGTAWKLDLVSTASSIPLLSELILEFKDRGRRR